MSKTTLSVKVSAKFAKRIRRFCDRHALQVGKFTENVLEEIMEDYHFGMKAQKVLSQNQGMVIDHDTLLKKLTPSK